MRFSELDLSDLEKAVKKDGCIITISIITGGRRFVSVEKDGQVINRSVGMTLKNALGLASQEYSAGIRKPENYKDINFVGSRSYDSRLESLLRAGYKLYIKNVSEVICSCLTFEGQTEFLTGEYGSVGTVPKFQNQSLGEQLDVIEQWANTRIKSGLDK